MFKKFVNALLNCKDTNDVNFVLAEVDMAFQREELNYKDHETLFNLGAKIDPNLFRAGIQHIEKEA